MVHSLFAGFGVPPDLEKTLLLGFLLVNIFNGCPALKMVKGDDFP